MDPWRRRRGVLQVAQACLEDVRDCIGQAHSACLKRLVHLSPACTSDAYHAYRKVTKNADFFVSLGTAARQTMWLRPGQRRLTRRTLHGRPPPDLQTIWIVRWTRRSPPSTARALGAGVEFARTNHC